MADTKISSLASATSITGTDLVPIVQTGANKKATLSVVKDYVIADSSLLKDTAIGVTVQGYDAELTSWAAIDPSAKQDTLVSGTNIKTINGSSLLGAGDLTVSASAAGVGGQVQFNDGGVLGGDNGLSFDKTTGRLSLGGKTVATSQPIIDASQTWNGAGVVFTGIKFNATDTASALGSLLMDLQVGGATKFSIKKDGSIQVSSVLNSTQASISSLSSVNSGFYTTDGFDWGYTRSGAAQWQSGFGYFRTSQDSHIGWASGSASSVADTRLYRDAANALAQRNGTNAQTSRLYGTYTDTSNYRRLTKTMSASGVAEIKPEGAGTGATGNVLHISGLPTANPGPGILWNDAGTVKVGT